MSDDGHLRNLYADVFAAGGLAAAVNERLQRLDLDSPAFTTPEGARQAACAVARSGTRSIGLSVALHSRSFHASLSEQGVEMAGGWMPDLDSVVRVAAKWLLERQPASVLSNATAWLSANPRAEAYERGEELEWQWRWWLDRVASRSPELEDFVLAAAKRPELRQLFPFQSMYWFSFSRCSGFPYTADIPGTYWDRDAYVVCRRSESEDPYHCGWEGFARGNAEEAVDAVTANLPPNCGPAVFTTADDLDA